jgi:hypothetical protein
MHDRTYSTHAHAHALAHARTHARTHPGMHAHAHIQSSLFLVADTCRDGPPWCASFGGRGLWCSSLALRWHRSVRSPPPTHARLSLYIVVFILLLTLFCNYLYQLLFVVTCVTHLMQRLCVCVCVCVQSFARNRSRRTEVYLLPSVKVPRSHAHTHTQLRFILITTCIVVCISRVLARACPRARVSTCVKIECVLTHLGTYVEYNE